MTSLLYRGQMFKPLSKPHANIIGPFMCIAVTVAMASILPQDMVERALVDEVAGERVASPGLYLHQMPYPCYKKDRWAPLHVVPFQYYMYRPHSQTTCIGLIPRLHV